MKMSSFPRGWRPPVTSPPIIGQGCTVKWGRCKENNEHACGFAPGHKGKHICHSCGFVMVSKHSK